MKEVGCKIHISKNIVRGCCKNKSLIESRDRAYKNYRFIEGNGVFDPRGSAISGFINSVSGHDRIKYTVVRAGKPDIKR